MSRTGLRLATATPALAALRPAHEHTRAEHARHARTMRARLASRAHALTWQHTLARARQKLDVMLEALADRPATMAGKFEPPQKVGEPCRRCEMV